MPAWIPGLDDLRSWNGEAALAALRTLVDTGSCELPIYDLPTSRAVGTTTLTAGPGDLILTEGIFAAELIAPAGRRPAPLRLVHHPPPPRVNFSVGWLAVCVSGASRPTSSSDGGGSSRCGSERIGHRVPTQTGATCARATVFMAIARGTPPGAG